LQIHPTRQCNLRCLHCYSSSGPRERSALDAALLCDAVTDAAAEGYDVVSLSGGEPLLYEPLPELLAHAHARGLRTQMTTNGMLLRGRRLEALGGHLDLLAISLDGKPASHNRLRASSRAFEVMEANLPALRESGIPFGFIFTLTQHNLDELGWIADFALDQGAKLLQIHPLELTGRAARGLDEEHPDRRETAFAFLEVLSLQRRLGPRLKVQLDLSHRQALAEHPERSYAEVREGSPESRAERPLADLVSPLVIEADGAVVPLVYGFSRSYALGNLHQARLAELAPAWKRTALARFRALCRRVHRAHTQPRGDRPPASRTPVFNWFEAMVEGSHRAAVS
jgi:MoaA/NifB/PqqE/SkfB family radical SAM enzyme